MIRRFKGKNVSLYIHINSKIYDNQSIREKEKERACERRREERVLCKFNACPSNIHA